VSQVPTAKQEAPLASRSVRGGLWVALTSYWKIGFGFAVNILLTRLLSPEDFGQFAYAMFFYGLLSIRGRLQLSYGFIRSQDHDDDALGTYVTMELGLVLVDALVAGGAYFLLPPTIALPLLVLLLLMAAQSAAGLGGVLLDKNLRFARTTSVETLAYTLSYLPAVYLAWRGAGLWSLVAQIATQSILTTVAIVLVAQAEWRQIWRARGRFRREIAVRYLRLGLTMAVASYVTGLTTSLDNLLVGRFVGTAALGFYDRAYRMAQWPGLLFHGVISRSALFTYAKLQDDPMRLRKTQTMLLWIVGVLGLPLGLLLLISAPDLIRFLYGERWVEATPYLRLLAVVFAVRPIWDSASTLLVAIGRARVVMVSNIASLTTLVVAGIPLTMQWGPTGTCVAVAAASVVGVILQYRQVMRHVPVSFVESLGGPLLASAGVLIGYVVINRVTPLGEAQLVVRLAIKVLYVAASFVALSLLVQPRTMRERLLYIWGLVRGS
jgi:PST family polysaccharide transporter